MDVDDEFYVVTRDDEKSLSYATGNRERVLRIAAKWNKGEGAEKEADEEEEAAEETFSHHSALSETLKSAVNFCRSQFQVLVILSTLGEGLNQAFIKRNIFEKLESDHISIEEIDGCKIYRVSEETAEEISRSDERSSILELSGEKIAPSIFMGMIASFDALIVDVVGKLIRLDPTRYSSADKAIPVEQILSASSIDELVQSFIADELYRFSRESHEVQTAYIEKHFSIKIREKWKRWPDFIEVFERRNLVAHGERKFNNRYVSICSKAGHKGSEKVANQEVKIELPYQIQALNILSEYAILLCFSLWRKHASDKESQAFETLNEAAFTLIQDRHYVLAERILEFALTLKGTEVSEEIRKMMVVNLASACRSSHGEDKCREILENEDWSASAIHFQLSVAALKGDEARLVELIPKAKLLGFEMFSYRTWPVFRFVRDNDAINAALEAAYGERLSKPPKLIAEGDPESSAEDVPEGTMH